MTITNLCGQGLCTNVAYCSYVNHGRSVFLCRECLLIVCDATNKTPEEIAKLLPEFEEVEK